MTQATAESPDDTDGRIRTLVGELGYEADVADKCSQFLESWNLPGWKQRLDEMRRLESEGALTNAEVALVQSRVLEELRQRLRAMIEQTDGQSECFHLQTVLATRKSQSTGNGQLLLVIGGAIGLDVRSIDVLVPCKDTLGEHLWHSATIVRLADGRVRMVDERWNVDSPPFVFTEHFARDGIYWKLMDESNPLGLHRKIRPIDLRGVSSGLLVSIADQKYKEGHVEEAFSLRRQAVDLDANSSHALLALAGQHQSQQRTDEAAALVEQAARIDPDRAEVHAERGAMLAQAGQLREAVAAYDHAIELKPKSPDALYNRGVALARLGRNREARESIDQSVAADPSSSGRAEQAIRRFGL